MPTAFPRSLSAQTPTLNAAAVHFIKSIISPFFFKANNSLNTLSMLTLISTYLIGNNLKRFPEKQLPTALGVAVGRGGPKEHHRGAQQRDGQRDSRR